MRDAQFADIPHEGPNGTLNKDGGGLYYKIGKNNMVFYWTTENEWILSSKKLKDLQKMYKISNN